jgi:hypothetical protein
MKENIWKVLAIVFFVVSIVEFILGFTIIKNNETTNTIKIKELEMKIEQLQNSGVSNGGLGPDDY